MWRMSSARHACRTYLFIVALICVWLPPSFAGDAPPQAAITSAHPLATRAGMDILAEGGNAFDAAVAVSAALAVVEPPGSGLGGGGFWLLHRASDRREVMIDGRERAPLAATRDMYLDENGDVMPKRSVDGARAAAIPGAPAALAHLSAKYGRLPLKKTLAPAIRLARDGFPVEEHYRRLAEFRLAVLRASPAAASTYLQADAVPELGHIIKQPDLASTLAAIAEHGADGFYKGPVAERVVAGVRAPGIDRCAQTCRVQRARELCDGHRDEIGITEIVGTIAIGASHGLDDEVGACRLVEI